MVFELKHFADKNDCISWEVLQKVRLQGGYALPGSPCADVEVFAKVAFHPVYLQTLSWAGCVTCWVVKKYRDFQTETWNIYMVADVCGNISGKNLTN